MLRYYAPLQANRGGYAIRLVVMLVLLAVGAGGAFGYLSYVQPVAAVVQESTGQVVPRPAEATPIPPPAGLTGSQRVNVLLLGSDTDAKFGTVYDTQIMMIVNIDPSTKQVSMLSIPRDLWVNIPGWGMGKIGTAYHDGGLALARQTVEQNFNLTIDYYAWVGLEGFVKVVDTFGGVDVDVLHPIVDDKYPDDLGSPDPYAYRRLYIPAGPQHLDGDTALEYVRSRHGDLIGDFGRSTRQQQVLQALRAKANGSSLVSQLPSIAQDLQGSLRTDMSLVDIAKFAGFADQIKTQAVKQYVLAPPDYSRDGSSSDGQSIVIPNWPAIHELVSTMIGA